MAFLPLKKWDLESSVPFANNISIDNTSVSAKKVAKMIKEHYNL